MPEKKGYPVLPVSQWWALREKFRKSLPGNVTANYVASVLNMSEPSARNNILPSLRTMGIIEASGKPSDLAVKWREDAQYADVCVQIRKRVYPKELLDIAPDASASQEEVSRWFGIHTGAGQSAVSKMTAMYMILSEADMTKAPKPGAGTAMTQIRSKASPKITRTESRHRDTSIGARAPASGSMELGPGLNINVQVHISSDATPDQIDQIFRSMAKHIYKRGGDED